MKPNEIERYLNSYELYPDSITGIGPESRIIKIEINYGDWKHEHGRCMKLMMRIGYVRQDMNVTEDTGSDCFSAVHTYAKI